MLLREVEYARAENVPDAIRLLSQHANARALAGGQTLVNVMKARAAAPDVLVDITRLEELKGIRATADGGLELGAMTTYTELVESAGVSESRPLLGEVANTIADVQVRNRGTVGGNVCSNDPTNHLPPLMVAMGAQMTIAGEGGERTVPVEDFFLGVYLTAAGPGELLTKVTLPARNGAHDGFAAVTIGREGTCIVNVAATARDGEAGSPSGASPRRRSCSPVRPRRTRRWTRWAAPTSTRRPTCTRPPTTAGTWPRCSPAGPSGARRRED